MSKAFTKDDEGAAAPLLLPRRAPLPVGVPNYVTAAGLSALQSELSLENERRAVLLQASPAEPQRLAEQAARLAELEARVTSAVLVESSRQPKDEVRFGARVKVRTSSGVERIYRIVGVDEANAARGDLAFVAPLAKSLLGKRAGDAALVQTPAGEDELEVLAIDYD